jgi:catechol 2,3-dioxygenase-like lactoylglutathione lyase family enzyme
MPEIRGVAHFSIPVSDVDKSTKFYTDVVGCKFLSALPDKSITFLDAGGVCVLLIKRPAPVNKEPLEMSNGVHHAFMIDADEYASALQALREKGVHIFFEEDRRRVQLMDRARIFATRMGLHWSSSTARPMLAASKTCGGIADLALDLRPGASWARYRLRVPDTVQRERLHGRCIVHRD